MSKENGGAAFPVVHPPVEGLTAGGVEHYGMTLRDYFAAKALAGMLADSEVKATREDFAERSYALADAMILERAK